VRDSTRTKQAADALIASEGRFRALAENASDIIRILDRDDRIVFETAASGRLLGYPEGYMIGRSPFEFIHPSDLAKVQQDLRAVYDNNNPGLPTEFRIRRADGTYTWVESTGKNLTGVPGVDGIMMTTRFIDGRKRAEAALKMSEEKFCLMIENSHDIIFSLTADGVFTFVSPGWTTLLGHPVEEVVGRNYAEFVHPADIPGCVVFLQSVTGTG
jgi:PAS domain S-box-containing protein